GPFLGPPVCFPWPPRSSDQNFVLGRSGLLFVCEAPRERTLHLADNQGGHDHAHASATVDVARGNRVASAAKNLDATSRWISRDRDHLTHPGSGAKQIDQRHERDARSAAQ